VTEPEKPLEDDVDRDVAELSRLLQLSSPEVRKRALELLPGDLLLELARKRGLV